MARAKAGTAEKEAGGEMRLSRAKSALAGGRRVPQRVRTPRTGWTIKKRAAFLQVLKESCNVSEAARSVDLTVSGAYDVRRRDAAFAAQWQEALEQGYAELEMLLLRQSIHGSETTETIDDGTPNGAKRTKTVHSYPHATALRLMLAHKGAVDAYRQEQGIDRPGSEAVRAEIARRLAETRARIGGGAGGVGVGGADGDQPEQAEDA
tara:strand:- start:9470 stop:10090 length:621 start_codon:yes stop_codon:yes gene_type:complete